MNGIKTEIAMIGLSAFALLSFTLGAFLWHRTLINRGEYCGQSKGIEAAKKLNCYPVEQVYQCKVNND